MRFRIFNPKFTWTRTRIINTISLSLFAVILFDNYIYQINISVLLLVVILFLFITGSFFKINGLYDVEKLKGNFVGFFELKENEILIQQDSSQEIIKTEDIKKIEISGVDWNGLRTSNYIFEFSYENGLSNGTKNFLEIELKNKQKIKLRFEQINACQFTKIRPIIENYYKKGIISYVNSIDVLCLKNKKEWEEFKSLK